MIGKEVQSTAFLWCDQIHRYIGLGFKGIIVGISEDGKVLVKFNTYNFEMKVDAGHLDYVNGK